MADTYWENQPAEGSPEWITANALSEPPADWQSKPEEPKEAPAEQPQEAPQFAIPAQFESDPIAQRFVADAATKGLDETAVATMFDWYSNLQMEAAEQTAERDSTDKYQARNELRWGSNFNSNVSKINDYLQLAAPGLRDVLANARFPDGRAVCNDPQTLQWLLGLASQQRMPTAPTNSGQSQSVEEEIARIERKIGSDEYRRSPAMQARLRELYDLRMGTE
ncbi:hypothetical protein SBBP2_890033 [Burkholderiales bacterium]|jgi:hypothetical protein|nr:hypothetical protein SBBP2_890033 [Burkholderiales bacterium]